MGFRATLNFRKFVYDKSVPIANVNQYSCFQVTKLHVAVCELYFKKVAFVLQHDQSW